jgi:HAD superfamily hydrolase (TIGR01509 family)
MKRWKSPDGRDVQAVIFDMDGVLVDSEPVITKAAMLALAEYGVQAAAEDFHPFTGMGEDRFIGGVAQQHGVTYQLEMKRRTYEIYLKIVDAEIGTYPGIPALLAALRERGLKTAVASSADAVKVRANLPAAGIDPSLFDVLCSGEDVARKKPEPDIFLLAAERLGVPPQACVVVEDALSGVQAARAADMRCVAVATSFPPERLTEAGADTVVLKTADLVTRLDSLNEDGAAR